MSTGLIIIGGGEHARVVAEAARSQPDLLRLEGFVDPESCASFERMVQIPRLGSDQYLIERAKRESGCWAVLGVGAVRVANHRRRVVESYQGTELRWVQVLHSAAWISPTATIQEGVVVLAGAVVNSGAFLGAHCVVNTGAIIEHDVRVDPFAIVSPGATVGGGAVLQEDCFIGLGARIRDHVTVGLGATVGMGAAVVKDVCPGQVVVGVPAEVMKTR